MKIQICSDLHLGFRQNREWIAANPLSVAGDILIVAGDSYGLDKNFAKLDFIQTVAQQFEAVYLVPGNHEYYGGFDAATVLESTQRKVLDNVFIVNNVTVPYGGYELIFSTMWSNIDRDELAIHKRMQDFRVIRFRGEPLQVHHYNEMHAHCLAFLKEATGRPGPKIVVTHHLPSVKCTVPEFEGSLLNPVFCTDKTQMIEQSDVTYWIYGHSHRYIPDFDIGGTRMVTNQLGYVKYGEHLDFQRDRVIEL